MYYFFYSEIKNVRTRARKHSTESLDALTKALCIPLRDIVNGYKSELRRLHPFERVVADLTARARQRKDGLTLEDVLVSSLQLEKRLHSYHTSIVIIILFFLNIPISRIG